MIAKLRFVLIATKYRPAHPGEPTPKKSTSSDWPGKASPRNSESGFDNRIDVTPIQHRIAVE
jgi:hypothetical protein